MLQKLKLVKNELLIMSLIMIALGIGIVIFPTQVNDMILRCIGIGLCVWGVLRFINYFKTSLGKEVLTSFGLVQGISLIVFGIFLVLAPNAVQGFFIYAISILVIIDGVLKAQYAIDLFNLKFSSWWIELLIAVAVVILGIVAFIDPFGTEVVLMRFIGIVLAASSLVDFISVIVISGSAKRMAKMMNEAAESNEIIDVDGKEV